MQIDLIKIHQEFDFKIEIKHYANMYSHQNNQHNPQVRFNDQNE